MKKKAVWNSIPVAVNPHLKDGDWYLVETGKPFVFTYEDLKAAAQPPGPFARLLDVLIEAEKNFAFDSTSLPAGPIWANNKKEEDADPNWSLPFEQVGVVLPKGADQSDIWKKEGRCPKCGELGHIDRSFTMICPTHGPY